ncbi:MAG TPA: hypothetical protein VFU50_01680, partial [Terriglobales bacterium]|nr:hypothetical protein [Terriglobales bacterium]
EAYAEKNGLRPEQIVLEVGTHTYRYLKAFTIRPAAPLAATLLDFDGRIVRPAIEQGYKDGTDAVKKFMDYVSEAPVMPSKHVLRLASQQESVLTS